VRGYGREGSSGSLGLAEKGMGGEWRKGERGEEGRRPPYFKRGVRRVAGGREMLFPTAFSGCGKVNDFRGGRRKDAK